MNTFTQVLAQLDAIFTVQAGLVFSLVVVCVLAVVSLRKPTYKTQDELDYEEMCAAYAEEAEAHYANEVVECSGMCLCENLYVFTTTEQSSHDVEFCTMIACSHCPVCNPEGLVDVVEDTSPVLHVVSCELLRDNGNDYIVRFDDGTYSEVTWVARCDMYEPTNKFGVIQDITVAQANALELYTGKTVIPF